MLCEAQDSASVLAQPKPAIASRRSVTQVANMLRYSIVFLIVAIVAAILGFGGIAGTAAWIAKVLFLIFLVLFIVSLIRGRGAGV